MDRHRYLELGRGPRRAGWDRPVTAKDGMLVAAMVGMVGSATYWWGVQRTLTTDPLIAAAFTLVLALAPPALTAFLIPWSPAGMLLYRIRMRTWGSAVVIGCALCLVGYAADLQYRWWAAQPVVAHTQLVLQQVVIGIIGFIIIPALLWTPVTSEDLVEEVRQAHLVNRYTLHTEADIAIRRAQLLRVQQQVLRGVCTLTMEQRPEVAGVLRGLVKHLDGELRQVREGVAGLAGATRPFGALEDNEAIAAYLSAVAEALQPPAAALAPRPAPEDALGPPPGPHVGRDGDAPAPPGVRRYTPVHPTPPAGVGMGHQRYTDAHRAT